MKSAAFLLASIWLALAGVPAQQAAWRTNGLASFDLVWQTVAETFYDPTFAGIDWPAARAELRAKAESASSAAGIREAISEMLGRLHRSHFVLFSSEDLTGVTPAGDAVVPIDVRIAREGVVVVRVVHSDSGITEGVRPGDILVSVDGTDLSGWRAAESDQAARRRAFQAWRRVSALLHGSPGSIAALRVRSASGAVRLVRMPRVRAPGEPVTLGNLGSIPVTVDVREVQSPARRRVGFIGFNVWMTPIDAPVAAAVDRFRRADGIVIDLRGNPGGLAGMMSGVAGHFIAQDDVRLGRMVTREAQLEFRVNPRLATPDGRRVEPFAGKVAILVDELTGSTSECFTGAFRDLGRARVFGRQTLGQALPALTKQLPNGDVLMYAVGTFTTTSGRSLEGEGIVPDEVVPLATEPLAQGRDPALEAALAWFDR